MTAYEVTILDQVTATDAVDREPNRIDILIQDVIAVADLVVLPRMLSITSVAPGLIRGGQSIVIKGTGFATSTAGNRVLFNGTFTGTVTAAAEDELTVTTPGLLSVFENGFLLIEVESPPFSATKGRARAWTKWSTAEEEGDEALPVQTTNGLQQPGGSTAAEDRPRYAEAEDYNRLLSLVEHAQQGGAESQAGGFKSRDDVGLVGVPRRNPPGWFSGTAIDTTSRGGESLVVDPSQAGLLALGWQLDDTLAYGGVFQAGNSGQARLRANGAPTAVLNLVETEHVAMLDGVIDLAWILVKEAGTDFITQVDIFVNGSSVFTDANNWTNNQVATFRPNVAVSRGDRIELLPNKSGTSAAMQLVGGIRVRYS